MNNFTPEETGKFEERAAILEFVAGFPRVIAERMAFEEIENNRKKEK